MNQTRTFLIFAWLAVATMLFMAWSRDNAAPANAAVEGAVPAAVDAGDSTVPAVARETTPGVPVVPTAPVAGMSAPTQPTAASQRPAVTVTTDVLRVVLDGERHEVGPTRKLVEHAEAVRDGVPQYRDRKRIRGGHHKGARVFGSAPFFFGRR